VGSCDFVDGDSFGCAVFVEGHIADFTPVYFVQGSEILIKIDKFFLDVFSGNKVFSADSRCVDLMLTANTLRVP
jgi:hypothetical protein